ncbi:MAG TPA: amidohydrolase family protein, partial [Dongiaceae bacterium]|nr:amidohydrolase family protein [Dongiaceae bacterium]
VHFHTHRADDIRSVLRLKDEFGFDLVLQHGTEAYKLASELAQRHVPVSMTIVDSPGGKSETVNLSEECGRELNAAGVTVMINTDDPITENRFLLRTASIAVRGGLPPDVALKALTSNAAEALRLDDRIGSLETGKDADFVVLSGAPFSIWTRVLQTYIDGQKVFDLDDDLQRRYQTGGFDLPHSESVPRFPLVPPPGPLGRPKALPASNQAVGEQTSEFRVLARVAYTVAQGAIEDALIHVKDGKIESIEPLAGHDVPEDLPLISATAVTPGLIDAFSTVPLSGELNIPADQEVDEKSDPNEAELRVLDGFNPEEPLLRFLLEEGVTTLHACPGRQNVLAGLSGVFRTFGKTADSMVVRFPQALIINLGEIPKAAYPEKRPTTRMGTVALIRSAFTAAANYRQKVKVAKNPEDVDTNLKNLAVLQAMDQKIATFIVAQRADDLVTGLRLAQDYSLRGVLAMAAEAYLVPDQIKQAKLPVVVHPTMQRAGGSMETLNSFLGNAAVLSGKGIPLAISSGFEGYVPKTRVVRHEAAVAMVYGLGFDKALASITIDAARILQIDDRYGSLEPGKVADLVLYDGHPFENTTHVTHVVSAGHLAYQRASRPKFPLASTGSFFSEPACCLSF